MARSSERRETDKSRPCQGAETGPRWNPIMRTRTPQTRSIHTLAFAIGLGFFLFATRAAMAVYLWTTIAGVRTGGGYHDGAAATSLFNVPTGVAVYASGTTYVYVADSVNNTIRRITIASGTTVDTLAGQTGVTGSADGGPGVATFNTPTGVAADATGNLYVADFGNNT